MTEPQLPFDPPLPASHPLANPPHTPPAAPPGQPGLPDKTTNPGTPLTLYGVPCYLIEFKNRRTGQIEFIVRIENNDDSLSPEIKKKLRYVNLAGTGPRWQPPKYASSAAKAIAAAERKLEKYLLPPKPPKPSKPPEAPLAFAERICSQTKQIVAGIFDAGEPELNETWYIDVVRGSFEEVRADRSQREVQKAKKAEMAKERELEEPLPPPPSPSPERKFKWKKQP